MFEEQLCVGAAAVADMAGGEVVRRVAMAVVPPQGDPEGHCQSFWIISVPAQKLLEEECPTKRTK